MTRKIISALLVLILCFSLGMPVAAADAEFIVDEIGYLGEMERDLLNKQAQTICDEIGVGIFFVFSTADDIVNYDVSSLTGGLEDYFVMVENSEYWHTFFSGSAQEYIDEAAEAELRDIYDQADTYIEGVSEFLNAAAKQFSYETDAVLSESNEYCLYDEANLLNETQKAALEAKLADISDTYNAQMVIYTIPSVEGGNVERYIDVLYETMDFGYGANHDGVLLLVCMDPRQFWTIGNGFAATAIGNSEIEVIGDRIESDMSDGNYADAFEEFADECAYYLDGYINGFPFNFGKNLLIALVIGIIAGLIVAFVLKGQLKSVHKQNKANAYVKQNSMNITAQNDIYLYRTVTRTQRSSSGGSSGSGSGRSKGGRSF